MIAATKAETNVKIIAATSIIDTSFTVVLFLPSFAIFIFSAFNRLPIHSIIENIKPSGIAAI